MGRKGGSRSNRPFVFKDSTGSTSSEQEEQEATTSGSEGHTASTGSPVPLTKLLSQGSSSLNCLAPAVLPTADRDQERHGATNEPSMTFPYQNASLSSPYETSWSSWDSPNRHHRLDKENSNGIRREGTPTNGNKRSPLSPRDDGTDVSNLTSGSESSSTSGSGGFLLGRFVRQSPADPATNQETATAQGPSPPPPPQQPQRNNNSASSTKKAVPEENGRVSYRGHGGIINSQHSQAFVYSSSDRRRRIIDDILGPAGDVAERMEQEQPHNITLGEHSMGSVNMSLNYSESDQTPIIRNTSDDEQHRPIPSGDDARRLPVPRFQPPSGLYVQSPDSSDHLDKEHQSTAASPMFASPRPYQQQRRTRRRPFCSGTQGIIVCCLVVLFIFGLVSVVVSVVLSRQRSSTSNKAIANDNSSGSTPGITFYDDDNFTLSDDAPSAVASSAPNITGSPTLNFSSAELNTVASAAENPVKLRSTQQPTSAPSLRATTMTDRPVEVLATSQMLPAPSKFPTPEPTSSPSLRPTAATTPPTSYPTIAVLPPLVKPATVFQEEMRGTGLNLGDTAGYSTVLSADGRIMAMGAPNASNVYVYYRRQELTAANTTTTTTSPGDWIRIGSILEGTEVNSQFGYDIATSLDGNLLVVSAPTADERRGVVRIFEWSDAAVDYVELQSLVGNQPGDHFGISVSMSDDGNRVAVGSPYYSSSDPTSSQLISLRGKVDIFERSAADGLWVAMGSTALLEGTSNLDWFGWSVSLSPDGESLAIGAPRNSDTGGYVQCYQLDGQTKTWRLMGDAIVNTMEPVKQDDRFGHVVSITKTNKAATSFAMGGGAPSIGSGNEQTITRLAIGSPWKDMGSVLNSGMVAVYEWSGSSWSLLGESTDNSGGILAEREPGFYHQFGYSLQLAGDVVSIGVPGYGDRRGLVNVYWLQQQSTTSGSSRSLWEQLENPLTGINDGDDFGYSVSMSIPALATATDSTPLSSSWLMLAVGAIMVTTSADNASGYTTVYETSTP